MGAGAGAYFVAGEQLISHGSRLDVMEVHGDDAASAEAMMASVEIDSIDGLEPRFKAPGQCGDGIAYAIHAHAFDVGDASAKPGDAMGVDGSRLQAIGHERRLRSVIGMDAGAPDFEWR